MFWEGKFGKKTRVVFPQSSLKRMGFDANLNTWSSWFSSNALNALRFWDHSARGW